MKTDPRLASLLRMSEQIELISLLTLFCSLSDLTDVGTTQWVNSRTDQELLRDYSGCQSEDAFAELVRRHVDFVYSAAVRMVRDTHLAEDVTQGVFVALAQNAQPLIDCTVLAGWLHRTTRNIAAKAIRSDARNRVRAQEAAAMNVVISAATDSPWEHLAPHLDAALAELTESDRDILLLRYFQKRDFQTVGRTLGVTDDTAQKRVSRAVERLRESLAKRGITIGASGLIVVISANAVQVAPVGLTVTISSAVALAGTTIVTTATTTASKALAMTSLQKTVIGATLVAAISVGIYEARHSSILRARVQALEQEQGERIRRLETERDEANDRLVSLQAESARSKTDTGELIRLRGEVSRLRQQLADFALKHAVPALRPSPSKEAEQPPEPVQIFVANADATVPAGETLAFGGWATPIGKRTLVFVQPKIMDASSADRPGSILLESRFIEIPDETLDKVISDLSLPGLDKLKADGKASSVYSMFTADEATLVLKSFENTAGVNALSAPRAQAAGGRKAVVSVTENKIVAGQEYTLGPSLEVEPRFSADGSSVNLTVFARLRKANSIQ